jgi:hypothetical protein
MEKMFKYKMVINNRCRRCQEVETFKHLIWECIETKKIWTIFNEYLTHLDIREGKIQVYDNIFMIGEIEVISKIKIRLIQEMIQIERPVNWSREKLLKLANEVKNNEMYNATRIYKLEKTKLKWENIPKQD